MQIAVCDDCEKDRLKIKELIEEYALNRGCSMTIDEYSQGVDLCSSPERLKQYKIIFLDINMEEMDGLTTAKKVKELYPETYIILVTAFMSYALEGYKVKASRFLIKDDLEQTLGECLEDILREEELKSRKISFSFVEGTIELPVQKIIYIETDGHKNIFYTMEQTYSLYKKLDEIEERLAGCGFVRVHQSFLINMQYIEKMSSYTLKLMTGKEISVPKSRYPAVKREYALFKGVQ